LRNYFECVSFGVLLTHKWFDRKQKRVGGGCTPRGLKLIKVYHTVMTCCRQWS